MNKYGPCHRLQMFPAAFAMSACRGGGMLFSGCLSVLDKRNRQNGKQNTFDNNGSKRLQIGVTTQHVSVTNTKKIYA
jgi:hypothetical protein